jgi:hypothetical protein
MIALMAYSSCKRLLSDKVASSGHVSGVEDGVCDNLPGRADRYRSPSTIRLTEVSQENIEGLFKFPFPISNLQWYENVVLLPGILIDRLSHISQIEDIVKVRARVNMTSRIEFCVHPWWPKRMKNNDHEKDILRPNQDNCSGEGLQNRK